MLSDDLFQIEIFDSLSKENSLNADLLKGPPCFCTEVAVKNYLL
jgi:hypothetical protein